MRSPVKKHKSLWLICLVLSMISGLAMADVSGQITGVRLDPEKGRIVILAKGNVGKHLARVIGQPNRLVMDFSDTGVSSVPAKIAGGAFDIHEIRVGETKSRARVVVDFQNRPVPPFTVRREKGEILVALGKSLAGGLSAPQAPTGGELSEKAAQSSPLAPQLVKASAVASRSVNMGTPHGGADPRQIPVATNLPRMTERGAKGEASLSNGKKLDLKTVKLAQRMDLSRPPSSQAVTSQTGNKESSGLPATSSGPTPSSNGVPRRMVREVRPPVTPPTPDPRLLVQEVTELKFVQVGHNARLVIRGGDKLDYRLNKVSPTKVRIDLINAEIPKTHQKALRTDLFSTSVEMIVPGSQSIFIQLKDSVPYQVQKKKGVLMVDFPPPRFNMLGAGSNERDTGGAATRIIQEEQIRKNMQNLNKSIENVQKEQEQLQKQRAEILKMYQATPDPEVFNKPVTLDFQGISLKNAFRLLAEQAGINIIVGGAAEGTTTLRLVDVPLGQVIDTLTTSYGLRRIMVGNVMRVGKAEEIKKWEDEKQKEYTTRIKEVDQRLEENSQKAAKYQKSIEDSLSELKKLQETPVERSNTEDFGEAGCIFIRGEKVCFAYTTVRLTYASPKSVVNVLDCIFRLQCRGGTTGGTSTTTVSDIAGTSGSAAAQANREAYSQQLADQGFTADSPGGQARLQQYDETRARVQSADALTSAANTMATRTGAGGVQISLPFGTDPVLARIIGYGMIWPDEDNRMIFIKDTPERIAQMKKLIFTLDTPAPQVQIESRLVQATRNWGRGLGIIWGGRNNQWGVLNPVVADTGWQQAYWGIGGNQAGPVANTPTGTTRSGDIPSSFAVNLPPASITGLANFIGMGVQFGLLNLPAADMITELDFRLQLGEATGQTKTIARPKVTVMNKQNATIKNGRTIAFSTVSASGTQTQLVNADLKLTVNPEVFSDGRIKMTLQVTDNDVGDIVNGQASLLTREASTVMVVKDGDTAVIGGIVRKTDSQQRQGFPGLMNIPVVNYIFSNKNRSKAITELLVFITPTIVRRPPPAS